jgi:RHS repeat-associated protein
LDNNSSLEELTQITEPNTKVTTFQYNPEGQRTQIVYPNGITVDYGWDASGRLGALTEYLNGSQTGQYLYTYVAGIKGTGTGTLLNTVPSTIAGVASSTGYTYDALNRLTAANTTNGGPTYSYTYDGDGNILSQVANGTTTTYGYTGDEQTSIGGMTATYDADGNSTSVQGQGLSYNTLDQPISQAGVSTTFFGEGEDDETGLGSASLQNTQLGLTAAAQNGGTSYITTDPDGNPLGELTPTGDNYFITNPVTNTVLSVTDANGNTTRANTYAPYGAQTTSGTGPNDIGWDGVYTASNSGTYHFGARQFAVTTDRWTQPDPEALGLVSDPTQDDSWTFAGDDPVNATDPQGTRLAGPVGGEIEEDPEKLLAIAKDLAKDVGDAERFTSKLFSYSLDLGIHATRKLESKVYSTVDSAGGTALAVTKSVLHIFHIHIDYRLRGPRRFTA